MMPIFFKPYFIGYLVYRKIHTSTLKRLYVTVGTRHTSARARGGRARGAGGAGGRGGVSAPRSEPRGRAGPLSQYHSEDY